MRGLEQRGGERGGGVVDYDLCGVALSLCIFFPRIQIEIVSVEC